MDSAESRSICLPPHRWKLLFTASIPAYDRIVLRRSKTLAGLKDAEEVTVWEKQQRRNHERTYLGAGASLSG